MEMDYESLIPSDEIDSYRRLNQIHAALQLLFTVSYNHTQMRKNGEVRNSWTILFEGRLLQLQSSPPRFNLESIWGILK